MISVFFKPAYSTMFHFIDFTILPTAKLLFLSPGTESVGKEVHPVCLLQFPWVCFIRKRYFSLKTVCCFCLLTQIDSFLSYVNSSLPGFKTNSLKPLRPAHSFWMQTPGKCSATCFAFEKFMFFPFQNSNPTIAVFDSIIIFSSDGH